MSDGKACHGRNEEACIFGCRGGGVRVDGSGISWADPRLRPPDAPSEVRIPCRGFRADGGDASTPVCPSMGIAVIGAGSTRRLSATPPPQKKMGKTTVEIVQELAEKLQPFRRQADLHVRSAKGSVTTMRTTGRGLFCPPPRHRGGSSTPSNVKSRSSRHRLCVGSGKDDRTADDRRSILN